MSQNVENFQAKKKIKIANLESFPLSMHYNLQTTNIDNHKEMNFQLLMRDTLYLNVCQEFLCYF